LKIPSRPGTYALVLSSPACRPVVIGKLGTLKVKPGFYVYVGSAFGPGGLLARIGPHRNNTGCPHWHMDYLGKYLGLDEIWYTCDAAHREHQWVKVLSKARGAMVPLAGFGSSDCRCKSHLYYFISRPSGGNFRRKLHSSFANHGRIYMVKPVPKVE
jgi:Uri superfamily endonuclease